MLWDRPKVHGGALCTDFTRCRTKGAPVGAILPGVSRWKSSCRAIWPLLNSINSLEDRFGTMPMLSMRVVRKSVRYFRLCDRIEPLRGGRRPLRASCPGDPLGAQRQSKFNAARPYRQVRSSRAQAGVARWFHSETMQVAQSWPRKWLNSWPRSTAASKSTDTRDDVSGFPASDRRNDR